MCQALLLPSQLPCQAGSSLFLQIRKERTTGSRDLPRLIELEGSIHPTSGENFLAVFLTQEWLWDWTTHSLSGPLKIGDLGRDSLSCLFAKSSLSSRSHPAVKFYNAVVTFQQVGGLGVGTKPQEKEDEMGSPLH